MSSVIGIDLGTTYCCVQVFDRRKGKYVVIQSRAGTPTTPSVVGLSSNGEEVVVGAIAKARMQASPETTVAQIKRYMGEPMKNDDGTDKLGSDGRPIPWAIEFAGKRHTPAMISAYVLRDLKELAEQYLGEMVGGAVITVPAYFKGGARQATEDAGKLAGLDVKCLISEPTAAAIAFGLTMEEANDDDYEGEDEVASGRNVLVYDLGGGTFDVSIIEIAGKNIEVKAVGGDHMLGGVDFDNKIVEWVLRRIEQEHEVDIQNYQGVDAAVAESFKEAFNRIHCEAEKLKVALSSQKTASAQFPFLFMHPKRNKMVSVEYELSRNDFLTMIAPLLKGTLRTVDATLADAELKLTDINDVLLVGGSTRIPKIRVMVENHFGKSPRSDINPDECVALGAATRALNYEVPDGPSGTSISGTDSESIAPPQPPEVIDVTGHSLGVREGRDNMSILIPKLTAIPASAEQVYVTAADFAKQVTVCVYQGEDPVASNNTLLTEFDVVDLPPLPAGQAKIKIQFSLDINGVLRVVATDVINDKRQECVAKYGGSEAIDPSMLLPTKSEGDKPAGGLGIPSKMKDTWDKAQELLPDLSGSDGESLKSCMDAYRTALTSGDEAAAEDMGNELMDTLFDVMPM